MRKIIFLSVFFCHYSLSAQKQKSPVIIPGQYIVVLKESFATPVVKSGLNTNRAANAPNKELRKRNLDKIKNLLVKQKIKESDILFNYADALVGFSVKLSEPQVQDLQKDPAVQGVFKDYEVQLAYTIQSKTHRSFTTQVEDCAVTTSGGHTDGSSKFTWIWIMDTGIDTDHPDLNVQVHAPYAAYFIGSSIEDIEGHGTHVAGIAAAKDNGLGVVGVSAGAKVVPVKVLADDGVGSTSSIIEGLDHISQYSIPGDVVNMSLGELDPSCGGQTALPDAIVNLADAGVWICIAAGNSTDNADFYSPGCFNHPRVLTVAAVDCENRCASFSNIGRSVDWYAVGVDVYSTYLDGGYATLFGTSMATPIVAGIVHSRGQAPIRGPEITCKLDALNITTTKWLAKRH